MVRVQDYGKKRFFDMVSEQHDRKMAYYAAIAQHPETVDYIQEELDKHDGELSFNLIVDKTVNNKYALFAVLDYYILYYVVSEETETSFNIMIRLRKEAAQNANL